MNPALKYTLARFGILFVCMVPAVFLFPDVNLLLKLLVAFAISALAGFFLLRNLRDEVANQLSAGLTKRSDEKERLRAALAGEDGEESTSTKDADREA